jgi:hypothetical protein
MRKLALLFGLLVVLTTSACGSGGKQASPPTKATAAGSVRNLRSIGELRAAFNAHPAEPRLIVLISPT